MEKGYDVTFLSDAIGANNVPAYEAAIRLNYPLIANAVITVKEFSAALDASATKVQEGDTVYGSDQGEIGTVEKDSEATDETGGYTAARVVGGSAKIRSFQMAANITKAGVQKIYRQKVILF